MAQTISIFQNSSQIISVLDATGCASTTAMSVPTVTQVITQVAVGAPGKPGLPGEPGADGDGVATLLPRLVVVEDKCLATESLLVDLISDNQLTVTSALGEVVSVQAYQSSRDITSAIAVDVDGSNVTLESNNSISNITIKLIGK